MNNITRISKPMKIKILKGEKIMSGGFRCRVVSIRGKVVELVFEITDEKGEILSVFGEGELYEGNSVTFLNLEKVFTVTVS